MNVFELIAEFLNVLENGNDMLLCISPNFWPYQLLMLFIIFCTRELFIYSNYFTKILCANITGR